MSAALLREAAAEMRRLAEAASAGPWTHINEAPCSDPFVSAHVKAGDWLIADCGAADGGAPDAEFIASWHPGVALTVANWLDKEADAWDLVAAVERVTIELDGELEVAHSTYPEALAVARAFLGRDT